MFPRRKASFGKIPAIAIDSERIPLVPETGGCITIVPAMSESQPSNQATTRDRRKSRSSEGDGRESEPLLVEESPDRRFEGGKTNVDFVPENLDESEESVVLEETEIPKRETFKSQQNISRIKSTNDSATSTNTRTRARLPTPPPPAKNVSFGQLEEQCYLEQPILPPPDQFVHKHRHTSKNFHFQRQFFFSFFYIEIQKYIFLLNFNLSWFVWNMSAIFFFGNSLN